MTDLFRINFFLYSNARLEPRNATVCGPRKSTNLFPVHVGKNNIRTQDRCQEKEKRMRPLESWLTIEICKRTHIHAGSWTEEMEFGVVGGVREAVVSLVDSARVGNDELIGSVTGT